MPNILNLQQTGHDRVEVLGRAVSESDQATPLYLERISAGFPSPADDYIETALDLNTYLVRNPAATFMVRVSGDSMSGAGINDGDILVVDRSVRRRHGHIVVAFVDGERLVKRLYRHAGRVALVAENPKYPTLEVTCLRNLSTTLKPKPGCIISDGLTRRASGG